MSTLSPRPLHPTFIPSINALLTALALPFAIDHPTDLTPSLLLAIFESLINARLPIPASVRQSRTRDAKARAMLVLLGVLECDVLRGGTSADGEHSIATTSNADDSALAGAGGVSVDGWVDEIGLGAIDPERLADGGWEETLFVGELLCWLARRRGILPRTRSSRQSSRQRSLYSNHHSYGDGEGDTADFSTSLLLRPSPAHTSRRPPSPSIDDIDADADFSTLSHITDVPRHPLVHSPEPSLSASATTGTDLSIRARSVSSRTSVSNAHDDPDELEEASQDTVQIIDPRQMIQEAEEDDDRPPTFRPRCIHDLEDPSYIRVLAGLSSVDPSASHVHVSEDEDTSRDDDDADAQHYDDLYAPATPTPRRVRLTGWIDTVDAATELSHFAASRSRASNTSAGLRSAQRSRQPQSHRHARTGEFPKPMPRLTTELSPRPRPGSSTPRLISPFPSPSPSPSPSPPLPASSTHPPARSPSPPPSPAHSDPPFDVSFSSLNNTSTPAKPRLPRRTHLSTTPRHDTPPADAMHRGNSGTMGTMGTTGRRRRPERSPSYTPSPPSFSTPGSSRRGGSSVPRTTPTGPAAPVPPRHAGASPPSSTLTGAGMGTKTKSARSPRSVQGTSPSPPPAIPSGSTATTNTLLTERARLLTELAALKRARAASIGRGTGSASASALVSVSGVGTDTGLGTGTGTGGAGVVGRRVGVGAGVRS